MDTAVGKLLHPHLTGLPSQQVRDRMLKVVGLKVLGNKQGCRPPSRIVVVDPDGALGVSSP